MYELKLPSAKAIGIAMTAATAAAAAAVTERPIFSL
jgi:hypothetical protein